jgi:hypothetical protein
MSRFRRNLVDVVAHDRVQFSHLSFDRDKECGRRLRARRGTPGVDLPARVPSSGLGARPCTSVRRAAALKGESVVGACSAWKRELIPIA